MIFLHVGIISKLKEVLDKSNKGFENDKGASFVPMQKGITFADVSFKYPRQEKYTLKNISFKIPFKKMIAVVGLSGAGKTTVTSLLTRLFDPLEGKILMDDRDLTKLSIRNWRSEIGVVSQNAMIFNDTVRENICFGTKASDAEIYEACRQSGCYELINQLTYGLDTTLGEHGYKVSGGEAQRITIARALIKQPRLLILDEATSSLDSQNEQVIQNAIENHRDKCSVLIIAHRLSTIQNADEIIVLDQGTIIEQGTHDELLEVGGKYFALWSLQTKSAKINQPVTV